MSEDGRLPIGSNVSPGGGEVRKRSTYVVPPAPFKLRVERPTSSVAASRLNGEIYSFTSMGFPKIICSGTLSDACRLEQYPSSPC